MESPDEYYTYGGEINELPDTDNWGTFGWAPFTVPLIPGKHPVIDKIYENTTLLVFYYDVIMYFEREKTKTEVGWDKLTLWKKQVEYAEALEDFWNSGMREYLAEKNKEDNDDLRWS